MLMFLPPFSSPRSNDEVEMSRWGLPQGLCVDTEGFVDRISKPGALECHGCRIFKVLYVVLDPFRAYFIQIDEVSRLENGGLEPETNNGMRSSRSRMPRCLTGDQN